jgi:hydrogenase expression/formation protein HypD
VTPAEIITQAITLAQQPNTIVCTFGDMLRVPTESAERASLLSAKAQGANVKAIYSPEEAVDLAKKHPDQRVVLLAVGFETTTPATAIAALSAKQQGLENFYLLVSHVRVPPALAALISTPDHNIDAFLAAGHVCTIMGTTEYEPIVQSGHLPIVITGFEPVDILRGVLAAVQQLERQQAHVDNAYQRYVCESGNPAAQAIIEQVYTPTDQHWRGLGMIPNSGWALRPDFKAFDATTLLSDLSQAPVDSQWTHAAPSCQAGAILTGKLKPCECPHFGTLCQPQHPLGAPMVSEEGACAAYFHHRGIVPFKSEPSSNEQAPWQS